MQPPTKVASMYYNYKKHTHSIILLAVVGPNYEGLCADVGTNGRVSDGGVWSKYSLVRKTEDDPISCHHLDACLLALRKSVWFL